MSKIKVAINGFGRIGRNVFKIAIDHPELEIIGINDLTDTKSLAHLLKYDSTQGQFHRITKVELDGFIIDGKKIHISA